MIHIDKDFLEGRSKNEVYLLLYILTHADENHVLETSLRKLSKETDIGVQEIRGILHRATHLATHLATHNKSIITIKDTTFYEARKKKSNTPKNTPCNTPCNTPETALVTTDGLPSETGRNEERIDFERFVQFFNSKVAGTQIPTIRSLSEPRKTLLKARAREHGKKALVDIMDKVLESDFLCGRVENNRPFVASFDFIFKQSNFNKILEGNYENNRGNSTRFGKSGSAERMRGYEAIIDRLESESFGQ